MKRRTLDFIFSAGGLALAGLLLVLGLVMTSNANFAKDYVRDQLSQQHITLKTVDTLTDEEQQSACLVKYAGQPLTTGKQAECYATTSSACTEVGCQWSDLRRPGCSADGSDRQGQGGHCLE